MNPIFYWNKKIDENYHTHMWTNRICTEKLLKENINRLSSKAEQAQRDGDYQTSAKIRYSDIPEIEKQIESLNKSQNNNQSNQPDDPYKKTKNHESGF